MLRSGFVFSVCKNSSFNVVSVLQQCTDFNVGKIANGFHTASPSLSTKDDTSNLPGNIEEINATEKATFSPNRSRDLSGSVIITSQTSGAFSAGFMTDQGSRESATTDRSSSTNDVLNDDHVENYDQTGVVSLNSVMQTTVPEPYKKSPSHLNMPGGHWGKGQKYVSQDMQHALFDADGKPGISHPHVCSVLCWLPRYHNACFVRGYCNQTAVSNTEKVETQSRAQQLKKAVKDYGATVVIFHVGISLISLGGFYLAVSSGIDVESIIHNYIGESANEYVHKFAGGASTFMLAYAIHKVFSPVRMGITLVCVPFIVRYLRRIGILKKPLVKSVQQKRN